MTKKQLKKRIMMGGLVVIILVIGYLVYSNFLSSGGVPEEGLGPEIGMEAVPPEGMEPAMPVEPSVPTGPVTSSKLKTDILADPRFADLKIFGDLPVEVGEVGRDNPFIPFEGYESGTGSGESLEEGEEEEATSEPEGGEEESPKEEAELP